MFPSWPARFHLSSPMRGGSSRSGGEDSSDSGCFGNRTEDTESPPLSTTFDHSQHHQLPLAAADMAATHPALPPNSKHPSQHKRSVGGSSSSERNLDAKTLRRLAQNREAARKSRLRKKAYVQQLETSRVRLAQLEQELEMARSQGIFVGGGPAVGATISPGAAMFDMEYGRWLEEDERHISELRTAMQSHLSDEDLRVIVDGYISHYDEIFRLKCAAAKSDVFHLITGMWLSQAERCFLWMGGFRPSDLIKMLVGQLDPLTEQQVMGIYSLQHSTQQTEEALAQGLEQLQHCLIDTISSSATTLNHHMAAIALAKLSNLEGFIRQADNLRQETIHQLCRILTVRQAVRCFLAIGEYYARLRALSSLWASRPRAETTTLLMVDDGGALCHGKMVMEQQMAPSTTDQNHFRSF
ncbi:unnamed protein product [Cuscuta campestris]|uniref:DOG1 domain-containing protein n=1 Tax=Cuscuta campestris TaxID=132261 RepID=A0A484L996_9ASTE|nr:unnamed protein product [Cuscuta campestris]